MNNITEAATGKIRHSTSKHSSHQINPLKYNRKPGIFSKIKVVLAGLALFGSIIIPSLTFGFTQSGVGISFAGNVIPMGHEWITRLAVLEMIGGDPIANKLKDPNDPRKDKKKWKAFPKNTNLSSPGAKSEVERIKAHPIQDKNYESGFKFIYDAILGERWVDIGGYNVLTGEGSGILDIDCWDVVAQEAVEVQYDHFMRRYDDRGGEGGVQAAQRSRAKFIEYFVAAAMAAQGDMAEWDGGAYSRFNIAVDRNYFLFGRAVHLFQDSFSSEHTVRIAQDNYEQLHQVKSYLCAAGSEQHNHSKTAAVTFSSGDVIWKQSIKSRFKPAWSSYIPSNMKTVALVAVEANKDLWAAFIRTMGTPYNTRLAKAITEANVLVNNWLHMNATEMLHWYDQESHRGDTYVLASQQTGKGQTVEECMKGLGVKSGNQMEEVNKFANDRRTCLYNVLPVPPVDKGFFYSDPSLQMPFNWHWRSKTSFVKPPPEWQPGMVTIPSGCYKMGWAGTIWDLEGTAPPHKVCVTAFFMDTHEVTQREYEQETGKNPSFFKGPSHPVENVTWTEADAYCRKVGKRLPTEAEWEYAEKAGWNYNFYWGDALNETGDFAWYVANSSGNTHRVGGKKSNNWGLFDMSGNVWEWVHDWYDDNYYKNSPVNNPQGPSSGKNKVMRGGSWGNQNGALLTYNRGLQAPSNKNDDVGFRCVKGL